MGLQVEHVDKNALRLKFTGRVEVESIGQVWQEAAGAVRSKKVKRVVIDAGAAEVIDSAGASVIVWVEDNVKAAGGEVSIEGLDSRFADVVELMRSIEREKKHVKKHSVCACVNNIGKSVADVARDVYEQIGFVGEMMVSSVNVMRHNGKVRWSDVFITAESAGADAFGIIGLIGFLLGLILAYQSVYTLKDFGAEIYVADIVSLSLFRELGPLMTAIVLAGRSGSAFAAEIGTMKVNEEINALVTMGLEPVGFLALPRIIAAVIVTPMLSLVSCFFGVVGAGLVMFLRGFQVSTFYSQVCNAVSVGDMSGGLVKAFIFGVLVAGIGCLRGLQTQQGARAVGVSATRAVVSALVLIVVADGVFAVVFNLLGI